MSTMSIRLPESLHKKARELAKQEGVSINQLIATALAEKVAALVTVEYLRQRAQRGDRKKFEELLARIPDRGPDVEGDETT